MLSVTLLLVLAAVLLFCRCTCEPVLYKKQIVIGIAVDEDEQVLTSVRKGLSSMRLPDTGIVIRELLIDQNASECDVCQRLLPEASGGSPVHVLIDATSNPLIRTFARKAGIPTISTAFGLTGTDRAWIGLTEQESEWLIQINPPEDTMSTMLTDLVKEFGIRNAVLLRDKSFGKTSSKLSSGVLNSRAFRFPATAIDHPDSLTSALQLAESNNVTNFVVMSQVSTINQMLDMIASRNMIMDDIGLYFVTKSPAKIKCPKCKSASLLLIQPIKSTTGEYGHSPDASLTRISHEQKLDAFFYYDLARYIVHTVHDLISSGNWPEKLSFANCGSSLTLDQLHERKGFKFGSELAMDGFYGKYGRFHVDDFRNGVSFQDVRMRVAKIDFLRGELYDNKLSEWNFHQTHGHFIYSEHKRLTKRSAALVPGAAPMKTVNGQKHMRIVMFLQPPFIMTRPKNGTNHGEVEYYGYCIDLLHMIMAKMNNVSELREGEAWDFTYSLYPVPDGRMGEKDLKTQKWDGVIGEIVNQHADIGLGPIAVMAERETVVDFTVPYYDLIGINVLMKKSAVPSQLFKFLTVVETPVWFTILGAYALAAFLLWAYDRISPYSYRNNKEGWADEKRRDFCIKECMWFCMTSLTPQGGGEGPQNLSGRLVAATWWSFGFFTIACYTANLAAFLTVSRLDSNMENLDQLSHQYRVRYSPQADTEPLTYFKRMAYIEHKFYHIWKNMSLNMNLSPEERSKYAVWDYPIADKYTKMLGQMYQANMPKSYHEGVRRVRNSPSAQEGFAFVTDAVSVKFAINSHCDLHSIGNEFSRKPVALVVQQNTTLKDRLSSAILKLLNERKLEALKEVWWKKYSVKCEDTKKSSDGISIHNIGGVFIVIFAGVLLACITLVIEYIMLRIKKAAIKSHMHQTGMQHNYNLFKANPTALAARSFLPNAAY